MSTTPTPPTVPYGPADGGFGPATEVVIAPVSRKRQVGAFALGALVEIALRTLLPLLVKALARAFAR